MSTRITAREVDRLAEIASEITGRQIERYGAYGATGVVEGARVTTCDWHGCAAEATHTVRSDVPRGSSFTTFFWQRCAEHLPPETANTRTCRG